MNAPYDRSFFAPLQAIAFEALTVGATAVGLTEDTWHPSGDQAAVMAHIQVEGASVRYRADGTDPTATVGTLLNDGDEIAIWGTFDMLSITFIRTGGVSATLNVHYYR